MVSNIVLSIVAWGSTLRSTLAQRLREESGQDLIEYVALAGFIGIAAIAILAVAPLPDAITRFTNALAACLTLDDAGCTNP